MKSNVAVRHMERTYSVLVYKETDGTFWGEVAELPGCFSQGETVEVLLEQMKEAIELYNVDSMVEEKPFVGLRKVTV